MAPFLRARWTDLLMLSWEVAPDVLLPHVPRGTRLDLHEGRSYASLVGFMFRDTRLLGVPVPWHVTFPEVNLRFYVEGEGKHGVAFLREIVPRRALAWTARVMYGERYDARPMSATIEPDRARFAWREGSREQAFGARGVGALATPRGLDAFLVDHLVGFVRTRGATLAYDVDHPPWRTRPAEDVQVDVDLERAYGAVGRHLRGPSDSAFFADGSAVTVAWPRKLHEATTPP